MVIVAHAAGASAEIEFERSSDLIELARARRDRVRWVDIGERRFLAVDGDEPPGSPVYQQAIGTLYPVAYTLHFALRARGVRSPIGMLEGLYWIDPDEMRAWTETDDSPTDGSATESAPHAIIAKWRLMLAVPVEATEVEVEQAILAAARRRPLPLAALLRVIGFHEGPCAQILHVGSYAAEGPTLRILHEAIAAGGFQPRGPHHEIYLNDPRQGEDRAKTLLRQPVAVAE